MRTWISVFLLLGEKFRTLVLYQTAVRPHQSTLDHLIIKPTPVNWKNQHFKDSFIFSGIQNNKYRRKVSQVVQCHLIFFFLVSL